MELKDFVVTPIVLLLVLFGAYFIRPYVTDNQTKKYFFPALVLKIFGAICVGLIYQFYYERGGDTYAYFNQSEVIFDAFFNDPIAAIKLMFDTGANYHPSSFNYDPTTFKYASQIRFYAGKSEFFIVRVTALFGLLTFHTYSATAILFATFSFGGLWSLFNVVKEKFPSIHFQLALAVLFLPSVVFWGSGIMKDTIVIGALGFAFYALDRTLIQTRHRISSYIILILCVYIIYVVKIYVLFSFIPAALLWALLTHKNKIKNNLLRVMATPTFIVMALVAGFFILQNISSDDRRYNIEDIAERTRINAEYLYYVSVKNEGSGYYLGELDGSFQSMLRLAPAAVNVTLFRPYLWEVQNPLMLLSFLEATFFLIATLSLFITPGILPTIKIIYKNPFLIFCLIFSIILAVGVGLNSFNFGTLVRYKIPLLPFYLGAIFIIRYLHQKTSNPEMKGFQEF